LFALQFHVQFRRRRQYVGEWPRWLVGGRIRISRPCKQCNVGQEDSVASRVRSVSTSVQAFFWLEIEFRSKLRAA
jgi:hypothetical protein